MSDQTTIPGAPTDQQRARLPRYVRDYLTRLERAVGERDRTIAALRRETGDAGGRVVADSGGLLADTKLRLATRTRVRFEAHGRGDAGGEVDPHIDAMIESDSAGRPTGWVRVSGSQTLAVRPWAANVLYVADVRSLTTEMQAGGRRG